MVGPDSDYDIMVIVPDDARPERLRSRLAHRGLRGTGTAADVVAWPRSGFECRAGVAALSYAPGGAGRGRTVSQRSRAGLLSGAPTAKRIPGHVGCRARYRSFTGSTRPISAVPASRAIGMSRLSPMKTGA